MGTRLEAVARVRGDVRSLAFSVIATLVAVIGAKCAIIVPYRVGYLDTSAVGSRRSRDLRVGGSGMVRGISSGRTPIAREAVERGKLKQSHE